MNRSFGRDPFDQNLRLSRFPNFPKLSVPLHISTRYTGILLFQPYQPGIKDGDARRLFSSQCMLFFACDNLGFFLRHICVDECGNIAPAVGKSKTKLNDSSNTLLKFTELLFMYKFPPLVKIFLVCGSEFVFLL